MRCPYCESENRDDREKCYHCSRDLTMLRLIVNRARNHYNQALEHAERQRLPEAIAELEAALELDSRLAEARLLLGTLYARTGRSPDARQEWEEVLKASPNTRRAHEYLGEVGSVERAAPLLLRVRRVLLVSALVGVGGLGFFLFGTWHTGEERTVRQAWAHFARHDLAGSEQLLRSLKRPLASRDHEEAAAFLERSLRAAGRERLALVNETIAGGRFREAMQRLNELESWKPPADLALAIQQARTQIRSTLIQRARSHIHAGMGPADLHSINEDARTLADLFPESADGNALKVEASATVEQDLTALLEEIDELIAIESDGWEVRHELEQAQALAEALGKTGRVAERLERLARHQAERLLLTAREYWDNRDETGTLDALGRLQAFAGAPADLLGQGKVLAAEVHRTQSLHQVESLRAMLDGHHDQEALDLAAHIDLSPLEERERADLQDQLGELRRRVALSGYYSLMSRAGNFEAGTITPEEAESALATIARSEDALPPAVAATASDDLLFFRAVCHWKRAEEARANSDIAELAARHPRSPYLLAWNRLSGASRE